MRCRTRTPAFGSAVLFFAFFLSITRKVEGGFYIDLPQAVCGKDFFIFKFKIICVYVCQYVLLFQIGIVRENSARRGWAHYHHCSDTLIASLLHTPILSSTKLSCVMQNFVLRRFFSGLVWFCVCVLCVCTSWLLVGLHFKKGQMEWMAHCWQTHFFVCIPTDFMNAVHYF